MRRVALVMLAACGESGSSRDAASVDAPPRCSPEAPFGAPTSVTGINSALDDVTARFTPDELTVTFSRANASGTFDLYTATRPAIDVAFETPALLSTINTINSDVWPTLSPDGLLVMFDSDVTGTYHIHTSTRASRTDSFGPSRTAPALRDREVHPMLANARAMYFASAVRGGLGAFDIWYVETDSTGATDTPVALVGGVNTADEEATPAVTADERYIFFRRTIGTESDVYTASRSTKEDGFATAVKVDVVATPGVTETPSWISPDGCNLYFHSNAPTGSGGLDIYVTRRGG